MRAHALATIRVWKKRLELKVHSRFDATTGFRSRRGNSHDQVPAAPTHAPFASYKATQVRLPAQTAFDHIINLAHRIDYAHNVLVRAPQGNQDGSRRPGPSRVCDYRHRLAGRLARLHITVAGRRARAFRV